MKAADVFTSKYLTYADLRGRDVTVTIDRVEMVSMPDGQRKPAVFFQNKDRGLVLNKTNFNTIAEATGIDDSDNWSGKQITIYPSETEFQGRMVDCIRVRRNRGSAQEWQAPPQQTEPISPDDDESIPF